MKQHTAWIVIGLGSAFLVVSWLLLSNLYFRDTVDFALTIERSNLPEGTFNPHHLLYLLLARIAFELWTQVGFGDRAILPMQLLSLGSGALGLVAYFSLIRRVVQKAQTAIWLSILFGFSFSFWAYAMQGMPYIFTLFFSVLFMIALLAATRSHAMRHALLLGTAHSLLTLFHESTFLLVPIALIAIWLAPSNRENKFLRSLVYLVTYALIVGGPYLLVMFGIMHFNEPRQVFLFLTAYAQDPGNRARGIGLFQPQRLGLGFFGLGNNIIGEGFFIQTLSYFHLTQVLFLITLTGWTQPVVQSIPPPELFALLAMLGAVLLGFGLAFFHLLPHWQRVWRRHKQIVSVTLPWFLIMGGFALWYYPENRQQWIPALVPFWMLFSIVIDDRASHADPVHWNVTARLHLPALTILVLMINLLGSILPMRDPSNNRNLVIGQWMRSFVTPNDLVIAAEAGDLKHATAYIRYYVGAPVLAARDLFVTSDEDSQVFFNGHIQPSLQAGKRVYVLDDVFDPQLVEPQYAKYSGLDRLQVREKLRQLFAGHSLTNVSPIDAPIKVYKLE